MIDQLVIYTDGGSRGNPGPGAAGFVIKGLDGTVIKGKGIFLGKTTNNVAEYAALLESLKAAKDLGAERIEVFTDSELMTRQINGQYKVKSGKLRPIYMDCMDMLLGFSGWKVTHISREKNKAADDLVNRAMDSKKDIIIGSTTAVGAVKSKPLGLGVLLSGGGRTMVNIQDQIDSGKLNAKIVVVISSRAKVKGVDRARSIGLEPVIIRRKDSPNVEDFSGRIAEQLDKADVDLVIQAGWLCLWYIPENYKDRVMNIHPALLPSFGGQGMWGHHVHQAVLAAGCKVSGCTVHFCTNEYDKGKILVQKGCTVKDDDDADSLAARVFEQECIAYPEAIRIFAKNHI